MQSATYVLPIRAAGPPPVELTEYLRELAGYVEVVVVDGSPPAVFAAAHEQWAAFATHLAPDADLCYRNGKVNGVLTGLRHATYEKVVIGDDDVRYDHESLAEVLAMLDTADLVGPRVTSSPVRGMPRGTPHERSSIAHSVPTPPARSGCVGGCWAPTAMTAMCCSRTSN